MDTQAIVHREPIGKYSKRSVSKLRAKVDPAHPNFKGEAWIASPDGQDALRRIAAYNPRRATPGRSTTAAKIAVRTQLASIQATAEATKANTEELIQRAQGKIPERPRTKAGDRPSPDERAGVADGEEADGRPGAPKGQGRKARGTEEEVRWQEATDDNITEQERRRSFRSERRTHRGKRAPRYAAKRDKRRRHL